MLTCPTRTWSGIKKTGRFVSFIQKASKAVVKDEGFMDDAKEFIYTVSMLLDELAKRTLSISQTEWAA